MQTLLGDHQDGVVAREALRGLAAQAAAAGESAFTWGLLYGHEEARAAAVNGNCPESGRRPRTRTCGAGVITLAGGGPSGYA